jgi:hypothetical protein
MVEVEIQIAIEVNDDGMIPLNSKKTLYFRASGLQNNYIYASAVLT